jgi:hypothetical protein
MQVFATEKFAHIWPVLKSSTCALLKIYGTMPVIVTEKFAHIWPVLKSSTCTLLKIYGTMPVFVTEKFAHIWLEVINMYTVKIYWILHVFVQEISPHLL